MGVIQLNRGLQAVVDDDVFETLNKYKWTSLIGGNGLKYAARRAGKKIILMHRVIANTPEGYFTDHINGDGLDNHRNNLRVCTRSQNLANSSKYKNNKSGYKGVLNDRGRWIAKINFSGKRIYLGSFSTPEDAARVYDIAAKKMHGQFAKTNFS